MKDLGYANGWEETPKEVKECIVLEHQTTCKTVGRCLREYTCPICNFTYLVDSSD
jgi:hypothetical protein